MVVLESECTMNMRDDTSLTKQRSDDANWYHRLGDTSLDILVVMEEEFHRKLNGDMLRHTKAGWYMVDDGGQSTNIEAARYRFDDTNPRIQVRKHRLDNSDPLP